MDEQSLFKFSHSHSFISGMCDKQDFSLWNRSIDGPKMMVIRVRGSDNTKILRVNPCVITVCMYHVGCIQSDVFIDIVLGMYDSIFDNSD